MWYCDLSGVKVGKKNPFAMDHMQDFFRLLPAQGDSERSWMVPSRCYASATTI